MIHGFFEAFPSRIAHHHLSFSQDRPLTNTPSADPGAANGGAFKMQDLAADFTADGAGDRRETKFHRFDDAACNAMFALRTHMARRAEMHEIRSDIRDLMGEVEGGQLTARQQETFDELVGRIAELRGRFHHRHGHVPDAEKIGARILGRFGVEPAPSDVSDALTVETATEPVTDKTVTDETASAEMATEVTARDEAPAEETPACGVTGTQDAGTAESVPAETRSFTTYTTVIYTYIQTVTQVTGDAGTTSVTV